MYYSVHFGFYELETNQIDRAKLFYGGLLVAGVCFVGFWNTVQCFVEYLTRIRKIDEIMNTTIVIETWRKVAVLFFLMVAVVATYYFFIK